MKEFGIIRHGEKLTVDEKRKPLEESGLSEDQQQKWKTAQETLQLEEAEIAYAALPKIENMAKQMYEQLPKEALVIFAPTRIPRARMTAELLSREITTLASTGEKDIATAFVWEPEDVARELGSTSNIAMYPHEMTDLIRSFAEQEKEEDKALQLYLAQETPEDLGHRSYEREDELIFKTANIDLASENSIMRKRGQLMKEQVATITDQYKDHPVPVYFYGVGHHGSLIALDAAFNGRTHYDSVKDMPNPLELWKANLDSK